MKLALSPKTDPATGTSGKVPWSPLGGVVFALAIFFGAQVVASLIVAFYPYARGWSGSHIESWLTGSTIAQFWYVLLAEVMMFGAIYWFLRTRKSPLSLIGWRKLRPKDGVYALAGYGIYFISYAVLLGVASQALHGLNLNQQQDIGFQNVVGGIELFMVFISLVVLPPLVEETIFRGFLFSGFKNRLPTIWAAVATSVLFAAAHLQLGNGQPLLWVAAIDTFVLSMVLCYLREASGGLWAGVLVHALKNGLAFVVLFHPLLIR